MDRDHIASAQLAESQTSDSTIMALAGHVSRKMLEHYSHVRQDAKRDAVNLLYAKRPDKPTMKVTTQATTQTRPLGKGCLRILLKIW